MIDFFTNTDLGTNIAGGVVSALVLGFLAYLWRMRERRIISELIDIMGKAIEHRNNGEKGIYKDENEWIAEAKAIEAKAISKANQLSPAAGALLNWLDRIASSPIKDESGYYIGLLSTLIQRIRVLLEKHS